MCTLAIAFRARPDLSLAVAANRDELYSRPSLGPRLYRGEAGAPEVLMPLDQQAGGTWLGLSARGLFVGVTNRAGGPRDPARRSRGLLVREALQAASARELHHQLGRLAAEQYNGFHLLYADRETGGISWSDGTRLRQEELGAGVHVLSERSFGAGVTEREPLVNGRLRALLESGRPTPASLREVLAFHGPEGAPLDGACVHADAFGYGTRSAFALVIPVLGTASGLWTEGPPCTAPAQDLSALVGQLVG